MSRNSEDQLSLLENSRDEESSGPPTLHYEELETEHDPIALKSSKRASALTVLYILFLSEAARGLLMPSQAEYVLELGGTTSFLGLTVAAFSGGRFVTTLALGLLTSHFSMRTLLLFSVGMELVASIIYFLSGVLCSKWFLLVGRLLLGLGAGSLALVRSYFALTSSLPDRSRTMAVVGMVQYAGFALSPALGSLISYTLSSDSAAWDEGNAPAAFLAIFNTVAGLALLSFFKEPPPDVPPATTNTTSNKSLLAWLLFASFLAINFLFRAVLGTVETLGVPSYDIVILGKTSNPSSNSSFSTSTSAAPPPMVCGALASDEDESTNGLSYDAGMFYATLGLGGLGLMTALYFLSRWLADYPTLLASVVAALIGNALLVFDPSQASTSHQVRYYLGTALIWTIAYPLSQTVLVSLFSKLPGTKQSSRMSWIGAAGSLGRVAGPLAAGLWYDWAGLEPVFAFNTGLCALILLIPLALWRFLHQY